MTQLTNIGRQVTSFKFFKFRSLGQFLGNFIQVAIGLGALMSFIWLIWGAIEFITSGGNQDRTKTAKDNMTSSIIGLAILAAVWAIWRLVLYFVGLSTTASGPLKIKIPSP